MFDWGKIALSKRIHQSLFLFIVCNALQILWQVLAIIVWLTQSRGLLLSKHLQFFECRTMLLDISSQEPASRKLKRTISDHVSSSGISSEENLIFHFYDWNFLLTGIIDGGPIKDQFPVWWVLLVNPFTWSSQPRSLSANQRPGQRASANERPGLRLMPSNLRSVV